LTIERGIASLHLIPYLGRALGGFVYAVSNLTREAGGSSHPTRDLPQWNSMAGVGCSATFERAGATWRKGFVGVKEQRRIGAFPLMKASLA
jgi:hypothetical protein